MTCDVGDLDDLLTPPPLPLLYFHTLTIFDRAVTVRSTFSQKHERQNLHSGCGDQVCWLSQQLKTSKELANVQELSVRGRYN